MRIIPVAKALSICIRCAQKKAAPKQALLLHTFKLA